MATAGNVIRWDSPEADGTIYGVTTDGMTTVSVTPGSDGMLVEIMNREGEALGHRKIYAASVEDSKIPATSLVNLAARGLL